MSWRNGNGSNIRRAELPARSSTSPQRSCLSSEENSDVYSSSTEATSSSMMLVGCPRCLMYVILAKEDPKCPKCKSSFLLDFLHQDTPATTSAAAKKTD